MSSPEAYIEAKQGQRLDIVLETVADRNLALINVLKSFEKQQQYFYENNVKSNIESTHEDKLSNSLHWNDNNRSSKIIIYEDLFDIHDGPNDNNNNSVEFTRIHYEILPFNQSDFSLFLKNHIGDEFAVKKIETTSGVRSGIRVHHKQSVSLAADWIESDEDENDGYRTTTQNSNDNSNTKSNNYSDTPNDSKKDQKNPDGKKKEACWCPYNAGFRNGKDQIRLSPLCQFQSQVSNMIILS